jgi:C-terminal processing protease CtpA/Prc
MYQESLKRTVRGGKWISILLILPFMLMGPAGVQAQEEEQQQEEQKCSTVTICPDQVGEEEQECRTVKVCGTDETVDPERIAEMVDRIRAQVERFRGLEGLRAREMAEQYRARAERLRDIDEDRVREMVAQARAHAESMDREQVREMAEEARAHAQQLREFEGQHARQLVEEARAHAEQLQHMERDQARDLAERYRAHAEQYAQEAQRYRDLGEDFQERWGQVAWVRSGARIGISLSGSQDPDLDLQGAEITSVVEDSPADEAGLMEGDIVTHINGQSLLEPIPDEDDKREDWGDNSLPVNRLMSLARGLEVGDVVEVRYLRDGDSHTVSVEAAEVDARNFYVGRWPQGEQGGVLRWNPEEGEAWTFRFDPEDREAFTYRFDPDAFEDLKLQFEGDSFPNFFFRGESPMWVMPEMEGRLEGLLEGDWAGNLHLGLESCGEGAFFGNCVAGLELRELNEGLGGYFGTTEGVLVLSVGEDSEWGIEAGDVILSVGGRDVEDPADVRRILGSYEDDEEIEFSVRRADRVITVTGIR